MRIHGFVCVFLLSAFAVGPTWGAAVDEPRRGVPHLTAVNPASAKAGDVVTASGEYLDKTRVAELYLTDGKHDAKTQIVEQSDNSIKFKVPSGVAPGRLRLMVLMAGADPKLLEQPVTLLVE